MNIYRGCTHGCIYCDSRSEVYGKSNDFENIEVKMNTVELIRKELSSKRRKGMIATGAMTDPYIPLEAKLENMRKCLEEIYNQGFGVSIITKSDLILRDIDILKKINEKTKCVVQMTLTTYDEKLCKIIEPNVCSTKRRFEVLKEFQKARIETVVWITPILPYINDTVENIEGILNYCKEAGVKGIVSFGAGMTLRQGNREYYYKKLDEHFLGLKKEYIRVYGYSYGIGSVNSSKIRDIINKFCRENNIMLDKEAMDYVAKFQEKNNQISMFDSI